MVHRALPASTLGSSPDSSRIASRGFRPPVAPGSKIGSIPSRLRRAKIFAATRSLSGVCAQPRDAAPDIGRDDPRVSQLVEDSVAYCQRVSRMLEFGRFPDPLGYAPICPLERSTEWLKGMPLR